MKLIYSFLLAIFFSYSLSANALTEVLIQLQPKQTVETLEKAMPTLVFQKTLVARLNIHLFAIKEGQKLSLDQMKQHPLIKDAMWNEAVESRNVEPNDPRYGEQWALEKIGMPQVWEIEETRQGRNAKGDQIVVAVIDTDFSISHEDLIQNTWRNPSEIANNGIDDDKNGFIDDVNGWNFGDNTNLFEGGVHGTSIAGIIGARGNNDLGVSGMNWEVGLMYLRYDRSFSEIFAAYDYATEMRKRYNESDGEEGAFIVAVNSSFGLVNPEICESNNMWNAAHDMMGKVGILIAAAAKNSPIDSDEVGDIPSSCPSDFIISVASTDEADNRWQGSAFGKTTIDIGAPGVDILTTKDDEGYRNFDANSAATPHIAGAVALLYSLPCEQLMDLSTTQPAEAARLVRSAIFEGVDKLAVLEDFTVTGGRLNVFNAVRKMEAFCNPNLMGTEELELQALYPNPVRGELKLVYQTAGITPFTIRIMSSVGKLMEERVVNPCCFKAQEETIDLSRYASGVYFLQVKNLGESSVQSFVVQ